MNSHCKRYKKKDKGKSKLKVFIVVIIIFITICILSLKFNWLSEAILFFNPIRIESISISQSNNEIELGEYADLNIEIYPKNYSTSDLQWHIEDEDIVEIEDNRVKAKNVGKTKIYLSDGETISNEIEFECLINIKEIAIKNEIQELQIGNVYKLETEIMPEDATYKELKYESLDASIIEIDNDGNIIANKIGKTTINIKDYKEKVLKTFEIDVTKIPVEKIELDDTQITMGKGQEYIINAKVTPIEATYTDVTWESSDENIVTIKDRKIKAINVGNATIKAITDNGDKIAECKVEVNSSKPKNTIKYANGNYNIRTGASTDYKILATTKENEEIEFLQKFGTGWIKVRNSNGIVGYTYIKNSNYYLNEKKIEPIIDSNTNSSDNIVTSYNISNVPYINQFSLGYPTGCEAVSATMVLKYKGYNVSAKNIIDNTKMGSKKHQENGNWYGANPFEAFVGNPALGLSQGSYGVFAKPISDAMSVYAGGKVKNISGCSSDKLFEYVSKGNPVVVWCVKNAGDLKEGVTWQYENGEGTFKELIGEHCAVLIGYDKEYVYLNDPSAGANVKQSKSKFISNWKNLYSQAIVVE